MAEGFSRWNAFLGWLVWSLVKWRLRAQLRAAATRAAGASRRARVVRVALALAVLVGLAAVRARCLRRDEGPHA